MNVCGPAYLTTSSGAYPIVFSRSGLTLLGGYLYTGQTASSAAGQIIRGNAQIVQINVSVGTTLSVWSGTTTIQLQQRTAVGTFTNIAGASVAITGGNYRAVASGLSIPIGPEAELAATTTAGVSITDTVLMVWIVAL